jgi:uncharacterized membrane protein YhaH (DUF805 family)
MNGEDVCYPAFLVGTSLRAKFLAFNGPEGLFISERFRPIVGATMDDVLIDSSGRSWTLHTVTAVGRWGGLAKVVGLWWKRRYRVDYEATDGPVLPIEDMRATLTDAASAVRKSVLRDRQIDKEQRGWRLKRWAEVQENIAAAENFGTLTPAMWPYLLSSDGWFSGYGRSNRAEYVSVVVPAMTLMAGVWHFKFGDGNVIAGWASMVVGFVLPGLLGLAAMFRRLHDFGINFTLSSFPLLAAFMWVVRERTVGNLQVGERPGWAMIVVFGIFLAALAVLPGIPGENQFGPEPNPGPSL